MSSAKVTLFGFYAVDDTLFDYLDIPDEMDKDILIDTILANCGELEPIFSDGDFLKSYIGSWSRKHKHTFEKWWNAYNLEYEALHNYDRYEEYDEATHDAIASNAESTSENKVSAFDSSSYQPSDKMENETNNNVTTDNTHSHRGHLYGNIGVTTSQQMLQAEYDIATWNIYNKISDLFADEMLLCVY